MKYTKSNIYITNDCVGLQIASLLLILNVLPTYPAYISLLKVVFVITKFYQRKKEMRQNGYSEKEVADSFGFLWLEANADVSDFVC